MAKSDALVGEIVSRSSRRLKKAARWTGDADALHDYRRELRRLREALRLAQRVWPKREVRRIRALLRKELRETTRGRDRDVVDGILGSSLRSRQAHDPIGAKAVVRAVERLLTLPPDRRTERRRFAARALARSLANVHEHEPSSRASAAARHRYRIALRRFRDQSVLLDDFGSKRMRRLSVAADEFQAALGAERDLDLAIRALARGHSPLPLGLAARRERAKRKVAKLQRAWDRSVS